eukprot:TRINITY_DN4194_c0_g3_i1.p1 TRINITY_DN4194_c0_g3~~TRINITY_DN4194_c0_g3_i1.p1  ORF type:complete len:860 (-),score=290.58 TRINITY_DN4194_c0_g3_i1:378-2957(-)
MKPSKKNKKSEQSNMGTISPERLAVLRGAQSTSPSSSASLPSSPDKDKKIKKKSSSKKKDKHPNLISASGCLHGSLDVELSMAKDLNVDKEKAMFFVKLQLKMGVEDSDDSQKIQSKSVPKNDPVWDSHHVFTITDILSQSLFFKLLIEPKSVFGRLEIKLNSLFTTEVKIQEFHDWVSLNPNGKLLIKLRWNPGQLSDVIPSFSSTPSTATTTTPSSSSGTLSLSQSPSLPNIKTIQMSSSNSLPSRRHESPLVSKGRGRKGHIPTISKAQNIGEYMALLAQNDPQVMATSDKKIKSLYELVSLKKKRYKDDKYDLDLAYITDKIIAMGFPSEGTEALYRNPMTQTQSFLNTYHPNAYRVYNLCSERSYPPKKFYSVALFPFDDHCPPTMEMFEQCCIDIDQWLDADPEHIVAIHCKAGKGRTGTIICAYLVWRYFGKVSVDEALSFYGERRTFNKKGVTIPSQRRFIYHFASIIPSLRDKTSSSWKPDQLIQCVSIVIHNPPSMFAPYFQITSRSQNYDYKNHNPVTKIKKDNSSTPSSPSTTTSQQQQSQQNDIVLKILPKFECNRETRFLFWDELDKNKKPLFRFWIHTKFLTGDHITLKIDELDKLRGKEKFSPDFAISFYYDIPNPSPFIPPKDTSTTTTANTTTTTTADNNDNKIPEDEGEDDNSKTNSSTLPDLPKFSSDTKPRKKSLHARAQSDNTAGLSFKTSTTVDGSNGTWNSVKLQREHTGEERSTTTSRMMGANHRNITTSNNSEVNPQENESDDENDGDNAGDDDSLPSEEDDDHHEDDNEHNSMEDKSRSGESNEGEVAQNGGVGGVGGVGGSASGVQKPNQSTASGEEFQDSEEEEYTEEED